jgi:phosphatidylserine decarboxylase
VKIDPAALPFIGIAAVPAVVFFLTGPLWLAAVLLILPVAIALFFRDPDRDSPADPALVLSPADGKVMHAGPARPKKRRRGSGNRSRSSCRSWMCTSIARRSRASSPT